MVSLFVRCGENQFRVVDKIGLIVVFRPVGQRLCRLRQDFKFFALSLGIQNPEIKTSLSDSYLALEEEKKNKCGKESVHGIGF